MKRYPHAHATHPDWRTGLSLALAQLDGLLRQDSHAGVPTLGFVYLTDHYAIHADEILASLQAYVPTCSWVGSVGVGVMGCGVEYFDEPALSLMLTDLPRDSHAVFSGVQPLPPGFSPHTALVHADGAAPDLQELLAELAGRTDSGYLFGGLAASRTRSVQLADRVLEGGLSGVAFDASVALVSRVTQGCQPVGPARRITGVERNVIATLDGEPALDCLLRDLQLDPDNPRQALPKLQATLVGLSDAAVAPIARHGQFGADTLVRHLIGIDPHERGIAVAEQPEAGMQLAFCARHVEAARRDLVRICAEIREELEPEPWPAAPAVAGSGGVGAAGPEGAVPPVPHIKGAIYVSCSGRGGPYFGAPSAELQLLRHALGEVPLIGFFAGGEIARHHLYGYTGVLTVFSGE